MFKKLIPTFLILIFSLFSGAFVSADSIPVEDIFSDISSDYKYKKELQSLYDRGMIFPDSNGKFNPKSLLNRDEFVGILTEVTCKKCVQPETSYILINKFENNNTFFDISKNNKYFYCIESSSNDGYVNGYQKGTKCEDGTSKNGEKPFCPKNTIILEEAISIILRASGILTNSEAESIRKDIYNGKITDKISDDVSPKNLDGSVYSFYPDLRKALEYEITDVDTKGNIKKYTLIDLVDDKLRPKQAISKEKFIRIAYVALKANSCNVVKEDSLALNILSDYKKNNTYDFSIKYYGSCKKGIKEPEGYIWRFYNSQTGEEIKKYGKKISNYKFLKEGEWKVYSRVIDNCGNSGEVYKTINIGNRVKNLNMDIFANPISGEGPLLVNFNSVITGGKGPFVYFWEFGDGNNGYGKKVKNIYNQVGIYEVKLLVKDSNGNIVSGNISIEVTGISGLEKDSDRDGISDINDLCPLIKGDNKNRGCPILEQKCSTNSSCTNGYFCSDKNICLPKYLSNSCDYSGGDAIFGNIICNSCPCNYSIDFISSLRRCDVIIPAITSKDSKKIYSKGNSFQIK